MIASFSQVTRTINWRFAHSSRRKILPMTISMPVSFAFCFEINIPNLVYGKSCLVRLDKRRRKSWSSWSVTSYLRSMWPLNVSKHKKTELFCVVQAKLEPHPQTDVLRARWLLTGSRIAMMVATWVKYAVAIVTTATLPAPSPCFSLLL